mgnify:CR=1 FL=1
MAIAKKKKKFFDVEIPLIKKSTQLIAYELKELDKKIIRYDLTRLLRGKSMILVADVIADGKEAFAVPRKIYLLPYFLRRMVRKGTNYVEDSFSANCKDAQIRIKPFLVTRRKVSRAVRKALREKAKEEITEYIKSKTFTSVFDEIIKNNFQKILSLKLKKIYPLSTCEIRILQIEKKFGEAKTEEKKAKSKEKKTEEELPEIEEEINEEDKPEEEIPKEV